MKKLLVILSVLLLLCGCASNKKEEAVEPETVVDPSTLTIVTPKGAPVLAFYDQIGNENYTRVTADAISALWTGDQSPDVIVVDLTSGVKAIENGAAYKLASIITFGNFYLASTGNDENETMDVDDKIVLFMKRMPVLQLPLWPVANIQTVRMSITYSWHSLRCSLL